MTNYANLTKESLRIRWLKAYGYIDDIGQADAYALNQADRLFNIWYKTIQPIIDAINELHDRIDHINIGCKLMQGQFQEQIDKCMKIDPPQEESS